MKVRHLDELQHGTQSNKKATSHKFQISYPSILGELKYDEPYEYGAFSFFFFFFFVPV